jgi:hypothetical protein
MSPKDRAEQIARDLEDRLPLGCAELSMDWGTPSSRGYFVEAMSARLRKMENRGLP